MKHAIRFAFMTVIALVIVVLPYQIQTLSPRQPLNPTLVRQQKFSQNRSTHPNPPKTQLFPGIDLAPVDPRYRNPWTSALEKSFQQRSTEAIRYYATSEYGNTTGENEKRSYPKAMLSFLAGHRDSAIAFLQREDDDVQDHRHTLGIDYYYAFTLKGQIRKYFLLSSALDPQYRQRMYDGAKLWTAKDPYDRPHPLYGNGDGQGKDWSIRKRGGWVDKRNTDNLRAMRETSVYLMAEETGNETVRRLYKQKLQRYVWALYHIGMGEWDSSNYQAHTFTAYLNLYDFAKDPEVKFLAKAALDWLSASAAVKYYRGGFGGPNKRDAIDGNVVYGANAARFFSLYFGDVPIPDPKPDVDSLYAITSTYRPPQAVVALARKQFPRPVEVLSTKPIYENWKRGGDDQPAYWETTFFGRSYQMGSIVSAFSDGDVAPFKLMASNAQRGVDFFVANTSKDWVQAGKHPGDQVGQFRNLLVWLCSASDRPFFFQLPKTVKSETRNCASSAKVDSRSPCVWFFQLENTWLAVYPINLGTYTPVTIPEKRYADLYRDEATLQVKPQGNGYAGFALEVGEATEGSYQAFQQAIEARSRLNLEAIAKSTVELTGNRGDRLNLTHYAKTDLPIVFRNGIRRDWRKTFDLYQPVDTAAPISLGWKQGKLKVQAGGMQFEQSVSSSIHSGLY
ncbi:MAG: hypothetical protein KME16_26380 [Scytolyngbya sp. HA4215-MV1]|nr:hypothetical protein [Scytolyngbya sp. HA4215-MV1]